MERFNRKSGKVVFAFLLAFLSIGLFGQEEKFLLKEGNEAYEKGEFDKADQLYNQALELTPEMLEAEFNKADVLYQQKKYTEAIEKLNTIAETADNNELKAKSYHNIGNSFLEAQQYDKAVVAYKNALKLNPSDDETRYNLAYALSKLQQQQQQQQQNKNKDQDQDKDKDQNKDQDKNKDQNKDQDQDKDKDKEQDKDQQNDKGDQNENKDQQQPQPDQLSKEDAERMLNALNNDEKDIQQKMKKKKGKSANSKIEKDW